MSKFKIEHGASKVNLVLLKTNIEDTTSNDIDLLATWSNNERRYIVNELLRFALAQEEDFQRYKASSATKAPRTPTTPKSALSVAESDPGQRASSTQVE
jgi:hypothetical protein